MEESGIQRKPMLARMVRGLLLGTLSLLLLTSIGLGCLLYLLEPEMARYEARVIALKERRPAAEGWKFHSRVYSTGFPLLPDTQVSPRRLIAELEARGYQQVDDGVVSPGQFSQASSSVEVYVRGYRIGKTYGASGRVLLRFKGGRLIAVLPTDGLPPPGKESALLALEPVLLSEELGNPPRRSTFVPLSEIPPYVQWAVLASEDVRFASHHGLDFRGILRAIVENVLAGKLKQGASTITQQLARTLFLTTERTFQRKLRELAITLLLDSHLTKDALLELYLNAVYLGQYDGVAIHGVQEAARTYFGKSVGTLTLAEAATLSGIIPAPNAYSPIRNPDQAIARRARVLKLMAQHGFVSTAEASKAAQQPLTLSLQGTERLHHGYFVAYVRHQLEARLGKEYAQQGLMIFTTLDPVTQNVAQDALVRSLVHLDKRYGKSVEPLMGAAFLLDPHSGQVLAVVGGRGYTHSPFNRAFQSRRQPGSAFKPIAFAAALEGGEGLPEFNPGTVLENLRRTYQVKEGDWTPRNHDGDYNPQVTLAKALTKSLNVATVNLVEQIGPQRVTQLARKLGLGNLKPVLSIGLGTNEVALDKLTAAYATFPARGLRVRPQAILQVVDVWGNLRLSSVPPGPRVLTPDVADRMVELLRSVVTYGTAWTLRANGHYRPPSAGKTGTSQDQHDAWYIGFTPELCLGVWVGFDTPRDLKGSASEIAVPVWGAVMTAVTQDRSHPNFELPATLEYAWIDPYTGGRATRNCPRQMRVAFKKGRTPRAVCRLDHAEREEEISAAKAAGSGSEPPAHALPMAGSTP